MKTTKQTSRTTAKWNNNNSSKMNYRPSCIKPTIFLASVAQMIRSSHEFPLKKFQLPSKNLNSRFRFSPRTAPVIKINCALELIKNIFKIRVFTLPLKPMENRMLTGWTLSHNSLQFKKLISRLSRESHESMLIAPCTSTLESQPKSRNPMQPHLSRSTLNSLCSWAISTINSNSPLTPTNNQIKSKENG